jgi:hypothetical protein
MKLLPSRRSDLRFHYLRHTGAVLAASTGAIVAELIARLDRATAGAAMRYRHSSQDRDQVIAAALSALVSPTRLTWDAPRWGRLRSAEHRSEDVNDTVKPGSLLVKRIPGKARPEAEAMEDWHELDGRFKPDVAYVLRRLYLPEPTKIYRWRVALSCGCVTEEWTTGPDYFPDTRQKDDPLVHPERYPLRELERQCARQHPEPERGPGVYRRIVEWVEESRKVQEHEADPIDPPHYWKDNPEIWARLRKPEPHQTVRWVIRLECGHYSNDISSVDFDPKAGPKRASAERLAEMKSEWAEYRVNEPAAVGDPNEAHHLRMLDEGWPIPQTEEHCYWCAGGTGMITAYQRLGWLEDVPKPPKPPKPKRQALEERLARLEAEEAQLRRELTELDNTGPGSD